MPFYAKPVADLEWSDVLELREARAEETVRLELKAEMPSNKEMLKKVCSLANTYGGYIILGAAEEENRLSDIPGVEEEPGFAQRLAQICFEQIYPPITPCLSGPISVPELPGRFVYAVFVEESDQAPHFVSNRRGCFVRANESSLRFEPKLATLPELEHLLERRRKAADYRKYLLSRAEERFKEHARASSMDAMAATLAFAVVPRFPGTWEVSPQDLRKALKSASVPANLLHSVDGALASQSRGFYLLETRGNWDSYLEIDAAGLIFFRKGPLNRESRDAGVSQFICFAESFASIVYYLSYGAEALRLLGYNGTLKIYLGLKNVRGMRFSHPSEGPIPTRLLPPRFDQEIQVELDTSANQLYGERSLVLKKACRELAFASGCDTAYESSEEAVEAWVLNATSRLGWRTIDGR